VNAETEPASEAKAIAIDLRESWHADWWARYFDVTRTELLAAIMEVGTDVYAVRCALRPKKYLSSN
jgi:hypothetical protein